jgi:hypothetical protein
LPFIGNQPALSYTSFAKQDFTTSATTSYTLDHPVTNENEIALFINFVRQEPTTAYTASGTSLTLTSATSASDDMYCVFLGKAVQTVNPPNSSVGTSQLADSAVSTAKIADDAVTKAKTSNLMYPAFEAYLGSTQNVTDNTDTKLEFDTEVFDTDGCYDNSTNYRFTPTTAGKYFCYLLTQANGGSTSSINTARSYIYKNGSSLKRNLLSFQNNPGEVATLIITTTINFNGTSDYIEAYGRIDNTSGTPSFHSPELRSTFGAYRIGD